MNYKIYENFLKVYEDGTVESLVRPERVKAKVITRYIKNLDRERADLTFYDPNNNYKQRSRSFLPIMVRLFKNDLPSSWVAYHKDGDTTNCSLSNIEVVSKTEILKDFYNSLTTYDCKECDKEVIIKTQKYPYHDTQQCHNCYYSQLNIEMRKQSKLESIKEEFSHVDVENTIAKPQQVEILKLRLQGKTYHEIGEVFDISYEAVRQHLSTIRRIGHFNKFNCKVCGEVYQPQTYIKIGTYVKTQTCKKCTDNKNAHTNGMSSIVYEIYLMFPFVDEDTPYLDEDFKEVLLLRLKGYTLREISSELGITMHYLNKHFVKENLQEQLDKYNKGMGIVRE